MLKEVLNDDAMIEREQLRHIRRNAKRDDRPWCAVQTGSGACMVIRFPNTREG